MSVASTRNSVVTIANEVINAETMMSAQEAQQHLEAIQSYINNIRVLLLELDDRQGWKALNYGSMHELIQAELKGKLDKSPSQLYRELAAAKIERSLSHRCEKIGTIPERHLEPLSKLTPEEWQDAWEEVTRTAASGVTRRHVQAVVNRRIEAKKPRENIRSPQQLSVFEPALKDVEPLEQSQGMHYSPFADVSTDAKEDGYIPTQPIESQESHERVELFDEQHSKPELQSKKVTPASYNVVQASAEAMHDKLNSELEDTGADLRVMKPTALLQIYSTLASWSSQYLNNFPNSRFDEVDGVLRRIASEVYFDNVATPEHLNDDQVAEVWQAIAPRLSSKSLSFHNWSDAELKRIIEDAEQERSLRYDAGSVKNGNGNG